jgi:hypothetical protein
MYNKISIKNKYPKFNVYFFLNIILSNPIKGNSTVIAKKNAAVYENIKLAIK